MLRVSSTELPFNSNERAARLALLALSALFLVLVAAGFNNFQIGTYIDDAHYIALARSLVSAGDYGYTFIPAPFNIAPAFPIGFPLVLAPIIALFPQFLWPLRLVAVIFTLINGLLIFHFWPRWTQSSTWWGVLIAGAYWLLPLVVRQARMVMSEALFLTLYLLLVAVVNEIQDGDNKWWYWGLFGALAAALVGTRTIGLAIIAGVMISFFFNRRTYQSKQRFAAVCAVLAGLSCVIALLISSSSAFFPQRYLRSGDLRYVQAAVSNIDASVGLSPPADAANEAGSSLSASFLNKLYHHLHSDLPDVVLPGLSSQTQNLGPKLPLRLLQPAVALVVSSLLLLGGWRWTRRTGWHVLWISGLAYAAALVFWSWNSARLLYAIIPHLQYSFLLGSELIFYLVFSGRSGPANRQRAAHLFLSAAVIWLTVSTIINLDDNPSIEHVGDLTRRTVWLREHATGEQLVVTEYLFPDYLYAGTRVMPWLQAKTAAELGDYLLKYDVDYLLLAPEIAWDEPHYSPNWSQELIALQPLVEALAGEGKLSLAYADDSENVRVYQVTKQH